MSGDIKEKTNENTLTKTPERHICLGLLAHVDAGKTTLAESLLYKAGNIRKPGRVDNQDAFLDTYEQEKKRGITIFSKQAELDTEGLQITLLDTPGHVDFSAEMERTLRVLDYAVLIISGTERLHGDVFTIWKLLEAYNLPVFIFINKMDLTGADKAAVISELEKSFGKRFIDADGYMGNTEQINRFEEDVAVCDDKLLERYLGGGRITDSDIADLVRRKKAVLCFSGSALKLDGIDEILNAIKRFTASPDYGKDFGARVFKIARDSQGNRLTYMKITGGSLRVKDVISYRKKPAADNSENYDKEAEITEKINGIRIYSGAKYETVQEVQAGYVCAVTGMEESYAGQSLGNEPADIRRFLEPVMTYNVVLPKEENIHEMFLKLYKLGEELPETDIRWDENTNKIRAGIMGEVQIEILKNLIKERFNVDVTFTEGRVSYKETIRNTVLGVGHFEPLRHYAEVHLLMEPGERGSGLTLSSECDINLLERNWQRLILTHLEEREHVGVLTGAPVTDIKITLISGKAHKKHTEGGDFREATYRAVRQGLKKAESVLLEPFYDFRIEVPQNLIGRVMTDIQKMSGSFEQPESEGEYAVITGRAPVTEMRTYASELASFSAGAGRISLSMGGYDECHNAKEVILDVGYDSERDTENPTGSVFCAHGAGFIVPWYEVEDYMHLGADWPDYTDASDYNETFSSGGDKDGYSGGIKSSRRDTYLSDYEADDDELEAIFSKTYTSGEKRAGGYKKSKPVRRISSSEEYASRKNGDSKNFDANASEKYRSRDVETREKYLLVDGYNIIFAWDELKELAEVSLDAARGRLSDILSNYQAYKNIMLILVFDAYKVKGGREKVIRYDNIYIVYTKEAETADQYIERATHRMGRRHDVTVATSDALEQLIVMGHDAKRISARGLKEEVEAAMEQMRESMKNISTDNDTE